MVKHRVRVRVRVRTRGRVSVRVKVRFRVVFKVRVRVRVRFRVRFREPVVCSTLSSSCRICPISERRFSQSFDNVSGPPWLDKHSHEISKPKEKTGARTTRNKTRPDMMMTKQDKIRWGKVRQDAGRQRTERQG